MIILKVVLVYLLLNFMSSYFLYIWFLVLPNVVISIFNGEHAGSIVAVY